MFIPQYFRDEGLYRFNCDITIHMQHGKPHCEDGPAVVIKDRREYYIDGRLHRLDGPAVECPSVRDIARMVQLFYRLTVIKPGI